MALTRITAGEYRSRAIAMPPGRGTRPTTSRVREALFNILGGEIVGSDVIDIYAGAGTIGFEALSRGAASATFVEHDRGAVEAIAATARTLGCAGRCNILRTDATRWVQIAGAKIAASTICFLDAPYQDEQAEQVLHAVCLHSPPVVVCEHHRARDLPDRIGPMERTRVARYGLTTLTVYRRSATPSPAETT